jgi:hypothetical protein
VILPGGITIDAKSSHVHSTISGLRVTAYILEFQNSSSMCHLIVEQKREVCCLVGPRYGFVMFFCFA